MAALVLLACLAFVTTNLDDFLALIALFSDPKLAPGHVVVGQFLGMTILTLAALVCALAAASVPGPYVGLLGILPLLLGLSRLASRRSGVEYEGGSPRGGATSSILAATALTAANGGDNIAVYVPLLVRKTWLETAVILAVFLALTAIWCVAAQTIVGRRFLGPATRRWASRYLRWLYAFLGFYLLSVNRAYTLLTW